MTKTRSAQGNLSTNKSTTKSTSKKASKETSKVSSSSSNQPSAPEDTVPRGTSKAITKRRSAQDIISQNLTNAVQIHGMLPASNPGSSYVRPTKKHSELDALDKSIRETSKLISATTGEGQMVLINTYKGLVEARSKLTEKQVDQEINQYARFNEVLAVKTEKAKGAEGMALVSLWGNTINSVATEYVGVGSGANGAHATRCHVASLPFDMNEINSIEEEDCATDTEEEPRRSPVKAESFKNTINSLGQPMFAEVANNPIE